MLANLGVAIHSFRYELNEKRSGLPENGSMRWPLLPSLDPGKGLTLWESPGGAEDG